jgi:hypothetical protein
MTVLVVSGALANKPLNGGEAWVRLNYILGFRKLGFDVYFIEEIQPEICRDEFGQPSSFESSVNLSYFKEVTETFGLAGRTALLCGADGHGYGLCGNELLDVCASACLLLNISGHLSQRELKDSFKLKAYIDLDPGFTQFWHADGNLGARLHGHDYYFTVGENLGTDGCTIPTDGIRWRPTRPPAVLDYWPARSDGEPNRFTTIASWRGPFGPISHGGKTYGSKVHQFRKYAQVPTCADGTFEIALDIHPDDHRDLDLLCRNSWRIVDPKVVAHEPDAFRRYVQTSAAEFSVAQEMYVATGSGWFSDRTVRYLASGKPALVENTGFSRNYPVGDGLIGFSSMEDAITGARRITANYPAHAAAARQLAESYFDSDIVLTQLLDEAGLCA